MQSRFGNNLFCIGAFIVSGCSATKIQEAVSTPVTIPEILSTPALMASFDQRLQATIELDYPDELVSVRDFIWVKTDDGHLVQVDPDSNSIVADFEVDTSSDPFHYCQGLGTDGEDIWVCSAAGDENSRTIDVVRIDSESGNLVATFEVAKVFDQFEMPYLHNHIWVLTDNGNRLVGIDINTNQPAPAIDLGARCFQAAATAAMLLISCRLDNLILVVDPVRMEVVERVPFTSPGNIAVTEAGIWVGRDPDVVRLDPETLAPVTVFKKLGADAGIFAGKDMVWVRVGDGSVYRIDAVNNELVEQIKPERNLNPGSILVTSDSIWVTVEDNLNGLLLRFSLN